LTFSEQIIKNYLTFTSANSWYYISGGFCKVTNVWNVFVDAFYETYSHVAASDQVSGQATRVSTISQSPQTRA